METGRGVEVSDYRPVSGPFASVRNNLFGHPIGISEATPESIVAVHGVGEMTLRSALEAGFVTQAQLDGRAQQAPAPQVPVAQPQGPQSAEAVIAELEKGQQAKATAASEDEEAPRTAHTLEPLSDERAEQAVANIAKNATPEVQQAAVEELVRTGDFSPETIEGLAADMDVSPEALDDVVRGGLIPQFQMQAHEAIGKELGTNDPTMIEAAVDWMRDNRQPGHCQTNWA